MDDKKRRARNLSLISFGIILYVLAGGAIDDNGSFSLFGGSFTFSNVHVVRTSLISVFLYFWYRHQLNYNLRDTLHETMNHLTNRDSQFQSSVARIAKNKGLRLYKKDEVDVRGGWDPSGSNHVVNASVVDYEPENSQFKWYKSQVPVKIHYVIGDRIKGRVNETINYGWLNHKKHVARIFFQYIGFNTFLDQVMPHFLAIIALYLMTIKACYIYL